VLNVADFSSFSSSLRVVKNIPDFFFIRFFLQMMAV